MAKLLVIGSGASGVHFSRQALRNGHSVEMVDVGFDHEIDNVDPGFSFEELKSSVEDPVDHLLGENFEGVRFGDITDNSYRIPEINQHVIKPSPFFNTRGSGFTPLYSFARGGLAQVWTAGCYPF